MLQIKKSKGSITVVHNGDQYTFGGHGDLLNEFEKTHKITSIADLHKSIVTFEQPEFKTAKLRKVKFDESYATTSYDSRKRKILIFS